MERAVEEALREIDASLNVLHRVDAHEEGKAHGEGGVRWSLVKDELKEKLQRAQQLLRSGGKNIHQEATTVHKDERTGHRDEEMADQREDAAEGHGVEANGSSVHIPAEVVEKKAQIEEEFFKAPIESMGGPVASLVPRIFCNIEIVLSVHKQLLTALRRRDESDGVYVTPRRDSVAIAKAFADTAPYLQCYSDYICGFEDSLQARGELDGDSMCRGCLEEITAAYRTARRTLLSLDDLLILPIQRVPRYVLLLTEWKRISQGHCSIADLQYIQNALDAVKEAADVMNETKKRRDGMERVLQLQKSMIGERVNFVYPHRFVVKDGPLEKNWPINPHTGARPALLRHFILFNDYLVWCSYIKPSKGLRGGMEFENFLGVSRMIFLPYDGKDDDGDRTLCMSHQVVPESHRHLFAHQLRASSREERVLWETALKDVAQTRQRMMEKASGPGRWERTLSHPLLGDVQFNVASSSLLKRSDHLKQWNKRFCKLDKRGILRHFANRPQKALDTPKSEINVKYYSLGVRHLSSTGPLSPSACALMIVLTPLEEHRPLLQRINKNKPVLYKEPTNNRTILSMWYTELSRQVKEYDRSVFDDNILEERGYFDSLFSATLSLEEVLDMVS